MVCGNEAEISTSWRHQRNPTRVWGKLKDKTVGIKKKKIFLKTMRIKKITLKIQAYFKMLETCLSVAPQQHCSPTNKISPSINSATKEDIWARNCFPQHLQRLSPVKMLKKEIWTPYSRKYEYWDYLWM